MTDKERWARLIDDVLADPDAPIAPVQSVTPNETPRAPVSAAVAEPAAVDSTEELTTCETPAQIDDELPIYEATPAQINRWHSYSNNGFLQTMLSEYDLDYASANVAALNHFKIGLDKTRHVATFAIDDTHYYAIQFNEFNTEPVNREEARRVLEKISALRIERRRFKDFCGYQVEYFD